MRLRDACLLLPRPSVRPSVCRRASAPCPLARCLHNRKPVYLHTTSFDGFVRFMPPPTAAGPARRLRGTDGATDGRLRAPSDATSMWAATDDAASAFVSTVIKRTRNCLLWKTGARVRVQRQRQRRRRLLLFQAWHAWRHWRRDGGAGQRARIKMSLSGPNIRMALSNVGDEREREAERVERHMADKNVYIRIDFSFPLSFVLTY